jgi:HlyD family secretion protein
MKALNLILVLSAILASCSDKSVENKVVGKVKRPVLTVASKYPGRVLQHYINEGQQVHKGDTLLLLDVPEIEAKLEQAKGAVEAARAQYEMALTGATSGELAQVAAKLEAVTEQYNFAEKSYRRIEAMHADSLVSEQKYDEVLMKYQGARAQLEGVRAKYDEVKKGVRNEKIRMALGTYERARGALQEAMVAYDERYLVAPQDMSIETIALKNGELALPGYGLVTGYQLSSTFFRFTVPENRIGEYRLGDSFTVNSPFTESSYPCELIAIRQLTRYAEITSAFPEYELGEAVFELKMAPKDQEKAMDLYANLTVFLE